MSFGEAVSAGLRGYFDFEGRASRSEFWLFYLFLILFMLVTFFGFAFLLASVDPSSGPSSHTVELARGLGTIILSLIAIIPLYAAGARRLHDIGRSGWWQLIAIVPFGFLVLIYWWCQPTAWTERA